MKTNILLLLCTFVPSIALDIVGIEVWNDDGSVRIVNSIVIQDGAHLTINEGVEIIVTDSSANSDGGPIRIESGGKLDIKGTKSNPVLVKAAEGLYWSGFQVYSDSVDIEYSTTSGAETMFYINNGNLALRNSFINPISKGLSCNGIYNVIAENNVFWDCEVTLTGEGSYAVVSNNTFYNDPNSSSLISMRVIWETNATIANNIFYTKQNPIYLGGNPQKPIIECNLSKVNIGKDNNYTADPLFVDPDNGNFQLQPFSPAIDAGHYDSSFSNEPGINGKRVNLGAYGNTTEAAESQIEMTSLNSGESISANSATALTWKSSIYSGNKVLEFSADNGSNWDVIDTIKNDSGKYTWNVPSSNTSEGRVRLTCARDSRVTDMTEKFSITGGTAVTPLATNRKEGFAIASKAGITEFSLTKPGKASLKIFSLNGVELASIESEGSNLLRWNHSALASQICVYKLTVNGVAYNGSFSIK